MGEEEGRRRRRKRRNRDSARFSNALSACLWLERIVQQHHARNGRVHHHEQHAAAARPPAQDRLAQPQSGVHLRRIHRRLVVAWAATRGGVATGQRRRLRGLPLLFYSLAHPARHVGVVVLLLLRGRCATLLADHGLEEGAVADAHPPSLDRRTDTVAPVARVARRRRQDLARRDKIGDAALVACHQAASKGVVVLLLHRCHPSVEVAPRVAPAGQQIEAQQLKLSCRQCARLVESNRFDARERFKRRRMLDQ